MDKGAHFYRCDFQVHSPRDPNWKGSRPTEPEDRLKYASRFIQACREKELHAVAITDHHDFCFFEYFREAAAEEKNKHGQTIAKEKRIVVFPGLELSLAPCQTILIFDPDIEKEVLDDVLVLLNIQPANDSEAKSNQPRQLEDTQTLPSLKEKLNNSKVLDRFIILPNVTSRGKFTIFRDRSGVIPYATMPCVGGYLDGSIDKSGTGHLEIMAGQNNEYGNKRIAIFQTSDSRQDSHESLGKFSTWVKWSVPTAEALRQACLAQESRVSQDRPELPTTRIKAIHVSTSKFLGTVNLAFNPQYTALIGSRGSGKSTILEYIRWVLCDKNFEEDQELEQHHLLKRNLIKNTLEELGATVELHFELNGVEHTVRREAKTGSVLLQIAEEEPKQADPKEIRSLLPIQAYSQKELSTVGISAHELKRFVESGMRKELDDFERETRLVANRLRDEYSKLLQRQDIGKQLQTDRSNLQSLEEREKSIKHSLTELTEPQKKLIANKQLYSLAAQVVQDWKTSVNNVDEAIKHLINTLEPIPLQLDARLVEPENFRPLVELRSILNSQLDSLLKVATTAQSSLASVTTKNGDFVGASKSKFDEWITERDRFNREFAVAEKAMSTYETELQNLGVIEKEIEETRARVASASVENDFLGNPKERFRELRLEWVLLHKKRSARFEEQCDVLTKLSGGEVRAIAKKGSDMRDAESLLQTASKGTNIRHTKISDLFRQIEEADEPIVEWGIVLDELEKIANHENRETSSIKALDLKKLKEVGFVDRDLLKLASQLTPQHWVDLLATSAKDISRFEFRIKKDEYILFEQASPGQQATALLSILLNQSGSPLIIDQPEDDLDNKVISKIAELLWVAKQKRQIIIGSHNANLVVNGDAELIVHCDYRATEEHSGGRIAAEGSIDIPEIRTAIKTVMEGGEKAFSLRSQKYGF